MRRCLCRSSRRGHRRRLQTILLPSAVVACASMLCANLLTCYKQARVKVKLSSYLRVTCHRKLLCGENTLSGRNIIHSVNAASRIDSGYLKQVIEKFRVITYRTERPNAQTMKIMETRSVKKTLIVFHNFGQKSSSVSGWSSKSMRVVPRNPK